MNNLNTQKIISLNSMFSSNFLDVKHWYLYRFNNLPSVAFINNVNGEKAFDAFIKTYNNQIEDIHQYKWYKRKANHYHFDTTLVILKNSIIVEFDEKYSELYYAGYQQEIVLQMTNLCKKLKTPKLF